MKFRTLPNGKECPSYGDEGYLITPLFAKDGQDLGVDPQGVVFHSAERYGVVAILRLRDGLKFTNRVALKSTYALKGWSIERVSEDQINIVNPNRAATIKSGGVISFLSPEVVRANPYGPEEAPIRLQCEPTGEVGVYRLGGEHWVQPNDEISLILAPRYGFSSTWIDPGFEGCIYIKLREWLPRVLDCTLTSWLVPSHLGTYDGGQNLRRF